MPEAMLFALSEEAVPAVTRQEEKEPFLREIKNGRLYVMSPVGTNKGLGLLASVERSEMSD